MSAGQEQLEPAMNAVRPLREVWSIAWPTALTMTSYTVMQFADKLMVAQVGPLELAAQGNGGIWAFTPIAFAFGVLTVVNTYVSQNLGAGRPENGPKYAWAAVWLSVAVWIGLMLPWGAALPWLFSHMGHLELADGPRLVRLETHYGQILLFGSILLLVSRSLNYYFFGLHRPRLVTVAAIVGNIVNVSANYVLIFGSDGVPGWGLPGVPGVQPLGIYGAALGTVIGTAVELAIPAAVFLGPKMHAELGSRRAWRPRLGPIKELIRIGWPASVQFGNEIVCWSIFMAVLVGRFGEDHLAAGWVALSYMHLSFMPAVGFSVAVTSLVGKYIGAGQPDTAVARARLGLSLAVGYMTVCAVLFLVFRHELVRFFIGTQGMDPARADAIVRIGGNLMICAAVFQTMDAFGIIYTGALRGAGDTVWPGVVTFLYSWTFIVAGGWSVAVLWPQIESVGPWLAAATYIVLYGVTMAWRFECGRWRSIRLLTEQRSPPPEADAAAAEELPAVGRAPES